MAIYHFSMKTISRSHGRSATAAIAYRAGVKIIDERTGEVHDYRKKGGVLGTGIVLPQNAPEWAKNREQLWNAVEQKETRKNSTVAREIIVALPNELNEKERLQLVHEFATKLVERHQCAVDFAIHEPSKQGDERNHHAHVLMSTRRLSADGFTEKTRELDQKNSGEVDFWRKKWAEHVNQRLAQHGHSAQISHLSLAEQGIDREPTKHQGVVATAIERKQRIIKENPDIYFMEKRRILLAEKPQIGKAYEAVSGYDFGVQSHQTYDVSMDFVDFEIEQQAMVLQKLVVERERLHFEKELSEAKERYQEKASQLSLNNYNLLKFYEKLTLKAIEQLPQEHQEKSLLAMYLNLADKVNGDSVDLPAPMKAVERQPEKVHEPKNRDDWEMER